METMKGVRNKLSEMKAIDVRTVPRSDLVDLNTVEIDTEIPVEERVSSFVQQVKNPYCFKVGEVVVKVVYKENGPSFQQNFEEMLLTM